MVAATLAELEQRTGRSLSDDDVRAAIGDHPTESDLERWALTVEIDAGHEHDSTGWHLDWFDPEGWPVAVALLPSAAWTAPAVLAGSGFEHAERGVGLLAVLRSWQERFGAVLVGHYFTMLEFAVERPPTSLDDAFDLAVEHFTVMPDTLRLPGVHVRDHAAALIGRERWNLRSQP